MQVTKETIVRAVLELLPKVSAPAVDVGELVLFLEREAEGWIGNGTVDLRPLWQYCRDKSGWQEGFFRELSKGLQDRFSAAPVEWLTPFGDTDAASLADDFASYEDGLDASPTPAPTPAPAPAPRSSSKMSDDKIIDWLLDGVRRSPVEKIIDPEKLRGFLEEALEEMQEEDGYDLQLLWDVMLDAEGVDEQMMLKAFIVMQVEHHNQRMKFSVTYPNLVANLPDAMRESIISSLGLEETKVVDAADAYAIKSNRKPTGSNASFGSSSSGGAGGSKKTKQEKARSARAPKPVNFQGSDGEGGLPSWLVGLGLVAIIGSALFYFFVLRTPTPQWSGRLIDSTPYSKYMSFEAIRINKSTVNVKATSKFMKIEEALRAEKAYKLWNAIRIKHRVRRMTIFSPEGKAVHNFGSP